MNKLTESMQQLITQFNAGAVATVNDDGTPAVSPKATFVIVNEQCLAFGNIRSPATVANIRARPAVEVNFIDILARQAVRVKGQAEVVEKNSAQGQVLLPVFEQHWAPYVAVMQNFVQIAISHAQLVTSPAYDVGFSRQQLQTTNLAKLQALLDQD